MFRNPTYLPFLGDTINCLILLEIGKQKLIRQSNEVVTANKHQDVLDEVNCVGGLRLFRSGLLSSSRISVLFRTLKVN